MTVNISFTSSTARSLFLFQYVSALCGCACSKMNPIDITPFGLYFFFFFIIRVGIHLLIISIGRLRCYFIHLTMVHLTMVNLLQTGYFIVVWHSFLSSFFSWFYFITIKFWCFFWGAFTHSSFTHVWLPQNAHRKKKPESNKNWALSESILTIDLNKKSNCYYFVSMEISCDTKSSTLFVYIQK